jgi:hypothetical protein
MLDGMVDAARARVVIKSPTIADMKNLRARFNKGKVIIDHHCLCL